MLRIQWHRGNQTACWRQLYNLDFCYKNVNILISTNHSFTTSVLVGSQIFTINLNILITISNFTLFSAASVSDIGSSEVWTILKFTLQRWILMIRHIRNSQIVRSSSLHLEMINSLKDFNKNFVRFHLQKFNSCATGKYNYFYTKWSHGGKDFNAHRDYKNNQSR